MKLPKTNKNEELEDASNNALMLLFDPPQFEVRKDPGRDKGIDFRIELKKEGYHTGFCFLVQLKATENAERNRDGSVSMDLDTSNINYLLNSGIPSYYVLFIKNENSFLYESVNDLVKRLVSDKEDWQTQDSHALRFHVKLDPQSIQTIYNHTLERGLFLRTINEKLIQNSAFMSGQMLIDHQLNVTSDREIRILIEDYGLFLINEARWTEVLSLHDCASQQVATTAKYNLVLGIANYYSGKLIDALRFLKSANQKSSELSDELSEHLKLLDTIVRYSLGIITKTQHEENLKGLTESQHIYDHVKIEQLKQNYLHGDEKDIERRYEVFFKEMNTFLESETTNENIKLLVRCELVLFEGSKINSDYFRDIPNLKVFELTFGENRDLRMASLMDLLRRKFIWASSAKQIKDEALQAKNYFVYFHVLISETKVNYEFEVYTQFLSAGSEWIKALQSERDAIGERQLENLEGAIKYYRQINHIENLCAALSLKYELLHFKNDLTSAEKVLSELSALVDTYEMRDYQRKLNLLRDHGTTHERVQTFFDEAKDHGQRTQQEYDEMVADMEKTDQSDLEHGERIESSNIIELFPIRHFQFPRTSRKIVYDTLNVSEAAMANFDHLFDEVKVIPVANIYNNPVEHEGYGERHTVSLASWRNIYRIRKSFFENGFGRIVLKVGQDH